MRIKSKFLRKIFGNSAITQTCVTLAMGHSGNGQMVARIRRDPLRTGAIIDDHGTIVYDDYGVLLADPEIDAIYIPCSWI